MLVHANAGLLARRRRLALPEVPRGPTSKPRRIRDVRIGYECLADRYVRGWRPLPGSIEFA